MNKMKEVKEEKKEKAFKLPKYLRLDKGSMFFDEGTSDASGVRIYAVNKIFVGRETKLEQYRDKEGNIKYKVLPADVVKDEYNNSNLTDYGKVDADLPWYFDTTKIPTDKLSRILTAYKYGILVEADPDNPPQTKAERVPTKEFNIEKNGDRVFTGKNKEMYRRLQNMNFTKLREFVQAAPLTQSSKDNLIDLFSYEQRGYNALGRPRMEVMEMIKKKLKEFGPSMSSIRVNED
jgi:hypothetical protein